MVASPARTGRSLSTTPMTWAWTFSSASRPRRAARSEVRRPWTTKIVASASAARIAASVTAPTGAVSMTTMSADLPEALEDALHPLRAEELGRVGRRRSRR